ncbi:hypothetical protein ABN034_34170 [Actinopolymorpha sp. B11F2]|uniref:hypothetical protein n=1 Tax=Actinopolymorpha sp. B11F2 TaxID=3160862 RepID=UPI0032E51140
MAATLATTGGCKERSSEAAYGPRSWAQPPGWRGRSAPRSFSAFVKDRFLGVALNTALFAGVVTTGLVVAAGLLGAIERIGAGLSEQAAAEAFASPTAENMGVFFNIANGSTEWLIMPAAVLLAWRIGGRRRHLVAAAVVVFYLVRAWTYLYFGPHVMSIEAAITQSGGTVPADMMTDVQHWTSLNQIRTVLDAIVYSLLLLAAFTPLRPPTTPAQAPRRLEPSVR